MGVILALPQCWCQVLLCLAVWQSTLKCHQAQLWGQAQWLAPRWQMLLQLALRWKVLVSMLAPQALLVTSLLCLAVRWTMLLWVWEEQALPSWSLLTLWLEERERLLHQTQHLQALEDRLAALCSLAVGPKCCTAGPLASGVQTEGQCQLVIKPVAGGDTCLQDTMTL